MKYRIEIYEGAKKIVESLGLKSGEKLVITLDSGSDEDVAYALLAEAYTVGAKPLILYNPEPQGVGKAADPYLPLETIMGALMKADAWVEFNNGWLLYSTVFEEVMKNNKSIRYLCLVGMDKELMTRTILHVNFSNLKRLMGKITEMTKDAKSVVIENPSGTHVEFENNPNNPVDNDDGDASQPGMHFLAGQIAWCPKFDTINGKIVFDGSISPPVGLVTNPVELLIESGRIVDIKGGREAEEFKKWLSAFNNSNMYRLAHVCYGFNPGAKLTGNILEDERVWGCTEWGIGYMNKYDAPPDGIDAPSHCDGICLNSTVILDGNIILENGNLVDDELRKLY